MSKTKDKNSFYQIIWKKRRKHEKIWIIWICFWIVFFVYLYNVQIAENILAKEEVLSFTLTYFPVFAFIIPYFPILFWGYLDPKGNATLEYTHKCLVLFGEIFNFMFGFLYPLFSNSSKKDVPQEKYRYISTKVQREVWRRDQGRCVMCGSRNRLEYDHIIPASKGGSNTARNIQLLCEKCNREKGANM